MMWQMKMNSTCYMLAIIHLFLLFQLAKPDSDDALDSSWGKRAFINRIENQREYVGTLQKRHRLARRKFEEHCEPQGKILQRVCPTIEQCLTKSASANVDNQIDSVALRNLLEPKEDANQFLELFNNRKRFFLSSSINQNDGYNEKHINERRRRAFFLYEDYCEYTVQLPRSCSQVDRCQCTGDCD